MVSAIYLYFLYFPKTQFIASHAKQNLNPKCLRFVKLINVFVHEMTAGNVINSYYEIFFFFGILFPVMGLPHKRGKFRMLLKNRKHWMCCQNKYYRFQPNKLKRNQLMKKRFSSTYLMMLGVVVD